MTEAFHDPSQTQRAEFGQARQTVDSLKALLPNSSERQKPVEVIHAGTRDLLINNTNKLAPEWGPKLTEAWRDGRPVDWDISMSQYPHENLAIGTIEGKTFIAKKRMNRLRNEFSAEDMKQLRGATGPAAERPEVILSAHSKNAWYSFESLLNEMHMAPTIREVVEGTEVQSYAYNSGFEGITFIEPIVGVIDRQAGGVADKTVIYEFIPEAQTLADLDSQSQLPTGLTNELVKFLGAQFTAAGITPSDLAPKQILLDNQNQLYLIDIEGYHKHKAPAVS